MGKNTPKTVKNKVFISKTSIIIYDAKVKMRCKKTGVFMAKTKQN